MQKHTLQPNKRFFFFFLFKRLIKQKEKYQQEKTKKNNSGLITDCKELGQKSHTSNLKKK
jgi:hypothetical protein